MACISFYNKTGIPASEVHHEFKLGKVKNLTGSLDVKGGCVFVSYKNKESAVQALQAFFFRKDSYPNMKFALLLCEKDYFGCFCLKFYNKTGEMTSENVLEDFNQYGEVVDVWFVRRERRLCLCSLQNAELCGTGFEWTSWQVRQPLFSASFRYSSRQIWVS